MTESLIGALLPVIMTVLLGYFSGMIKSFPKNVSATLNHLVMSYALPLSLFFSINQMPKEQILANWKIVLWQFIGMASWWLIVFLFSRYVLKSGPVVSPIRAFALSTPAILFVGPALLQPLFPTTATIAISIGGLMINLVTLPLTVLALSSVDAHSQVASHHNILITTLIDGIKKPVIFSAVIGLLTALLGLKLPSIFEATFMELGKAAAGVGLFSIGLILFYHRPSFSKAVWGDVLVKELVVPLSIMALMLLLDEPATLINETTLTFMISQMIFPTILAQQYGEGEREMASAIFLTTVSSFFVMTAFLIVRGIGA